MNPPIDFEEFKNSNKELGFPELPEIKDDDDSDLDMPPMERGVMERRGDVPMQDEELPEE